MKTNVTVHLLPPNTTAHLRDAGIIDSFKVVQAQHQKLLDRDSVSQQTIFNCWQRILPQDEMSATIEDHDDRAIRSWRYKS
ncbi:hypothetical protein C1646_759554 [Rhizophagus diaphanus]|nr:hypothetical protein C1646_759554 [Rhizophagus diaphanus] [Rhizophagus sp. MUCL 43196]